MSCLMIERRMQDFLFLQMGNAVKERKRIRRNDLFLCQEKCENEKTGNDLSPCDVGGG